MAEILETVAALIWISGGLYSIYAIRRFIKRCDKVIKEMEADVERGRRELEWK